MSAIYIQNLLTLRRKEAGKILSPSRARAESKLLFNQALKILSTTIEKTADDDFPQRYHGILNLPGNEAPFSSQIDLFERLVVFKGHSLILTQPGKNDDSVWTLGQKTADGTRNYFWFPPVDASSLMVRLINVITAARALMSLTGGTWPSWFLTAMFLHWYGF